MMMIIINNKKIILSKCGDNLIALKISSLFKQSIYLSCLFCVFSLFSSFIFNLSLSIIRLDYVA